MGMTGKRRGLISTWQLLLTTMAVTILILFTGYTKAESSPNLVRGVLIDVSRMQLTPKTVEANLNEIKHQGGNLVILHLSDNQKIMVENHFLGLKADDKRWSLQQLKQVISFGKRQGVQVVPEIDLPGHSQEWIKLIKRHTTVSQQKKLLYDDTQFNINNSETVEYLMRLTDEYLKLTPKRNYFSFGGDEYAIGNSEYNQMQAVNFDNQLNQFVKQNGLKLMLYNDSFNSSLLSHYDKDITINYWSYYDPWSPTQRQLEDKNNHATMPQLTNNDFNVINMNGESNYVSGSKKGMNNFSLNYFRNRLNSWSVQTWNPTLDQNDNSKNLIGSTMAFWGNPNLSMNVSNAQFLQRAELFEKVFLHKLRESNH
ncbi:family 20 glycosylhydrolase [Lactobacillus sp. Sy-1]|uniref:family 20 glycosylhydrolase n=1 Tax=Lactobacillus sp. Sy-1 TaxID=2109645 RepID=UPI001C5A757D|nr:family 20 glycosylhydrolase [Lactobacillus sp. Sy-1]MBW1605863.1 family 20 glycosylhydrolase [Lactobacillus sp. Sy-1]